MNKKSFIKHLSLSVAVHTLLLSMMYLSSFFVEHKKPIETVQIDFVEEKVQNNLEKNKKYQMVETKLTKKSEFVKDDVTKLGEQNQIVEKETISKNHGQFKNVETQNPSNSASQPQKSLSGNKRYSLKDLVPKLDLSGALKVAKNENQDNNQQQVSGGTQSQSLDRIKELEPSLETMLSTREFVYHSYYRRIRNQLAQHWEDMVKLRLNTMYKQGRQIASTDDKLTKVLIILDSSGTLIKVQIIGNSGVRDLDEAAVDAFRAAAPFPNPPKGIIDPDGTIKIRWDFILEA